MLLEPGLGVLYECTLEFLQPEAASGAREHEADVHSNWNIVELKYNEPDVNIVTPVN